MKLRFISVEKVAKRKGDFYTRDDGNEEAIPKEKIRSMMTLEAIKPLSRYDKKIFFVDRRDVNTDPCKCKHEITCK